MESVYSNRNEGRLIAKIKNLDKYKINIVFVVTFLTLWLFLYVAAEVTENKTGDPSWLSADATLGHIFNSARTNTLTSLMTTFTYLGSTLSLSIIAFIAVIFLHFKNDFSSRRLVLSSVILSMLLIQSFKHYFGRIRPDSSNWLLSASGLSFPSGHTTGSTAVLGALFYVLGRNLSSPKEQWTIWLTGFVIILMIGLSRVYLGVHYATDVLGGFFLGTSILFASIAYDQYRERGRTDGVLP